MFCTCSTKKASFVRIIGREEFWMPKPHAAACDWMVRMEFNGLVLRRDELALARKLFHLRLQCRDLRRRPPDTVSTCDAPRPAGRCKLPQSEKCGQINTQFSTISSTTATPTTRRRSIGRSWAKYFFIAVPPPSAAVPG